ncbi:MAG: sulfotransferase family 2 domain-containing protein [Salibacteraceae bacterium]
MLINKLLHFYPNKYLFSHISSRKYYLSYCFEHKALWFRVYKVATRTINQRLINSSSGNYVYSSPVGYLPWRYEDYFKFAFVRNPLDRFVSGWKDKVLNQNYYQFSIEEHELMKNIETFIEWVSKFDLEQSDEHLRAQYSLIDLNNLDFLGRFENFENDFKIVSDRLGLRPYSKEKLNQSGRGQISLTNEQKHKIARLYEKDIRIFYPELIDLL